MRRYITVLLREKGIREGGEEIHHCATKGEERGDTSWAMKVIRLWGLFFVFSYIIMIYREVRNINFLFSGKNPCIALLTTMSRNGEFLLTADFNMRLCYEKKNIYLNHQFGKMYYFCS